jgi:hypothetical protein
MSTLDSRRARGRPICRGSGLPVALVPIDSSLPSESLMWHYRPGALGSVSLLTICATRGGPGSRTCFQLPAVLTTPANRAPPSEVGNARADQHPLAIAEEQ